MHSLSTVSICAFRSDIVEFCKRACDSLVEKIFVSLTDKNLKSSLEFNSLSKEKSSPAIIVIDSLFLQNASSSCFKKLEKNSSLVICFLSSDEKSNIRSYAEEKFRFVLPFPAKENMFVDCCKIIISEYEMEQKSSICLEDEKEKCSQAKDFSQKKSFLPEEKSLPDSLFGFFAGNSRAIKDIRTKILNYSKNDFPLLLLGETGSGKSSAAKIIHQLSARKERDFVSVNASSVVDSLAVSSFFGVNSGAYTDAIKQKGAIKNADKGTLFIDEIGTASVNLQAMLLSVLENGLVQAVGSDICQKVDVRFLFATNANLSQLMKQGLFRQDLFFRISDNLIVFPPLRERREDIPMIASSIAKEMNCTLSYKALQFLCDYDWPGNIRELKQCIRRATSFNEKIISEDMIDFGYFS